MRLVSTGGLLINPLLLSPEVIQAKAAGDQVADARRHPFDPTRHPEFARRHPKRTGEFREGRARRASAPLGGGSDAV